MFDTLSDRLAATFKNLRGKGRLSEADIDATAREIRIALLEADVALPVVRSFIKQVKERALGLEVSQALNPAQQVIKIVNEELIAILGGETRRLRFAKTAPTVIMLAGLQGAGKTTLAGKLGVWLKSQGHSPLLVACDLQRPNAVNQLSVVADRAGVAFYGPQPGNGVGDPVQVAKDSIEHARTKLYDVVIVDTAGRLGIDQELMQQVADIRDAVSPDEVLFVVDAMIGQDAVNTAEAFRDGVGFDGVALQPTATPAVVPRSPSRTSPASRSCSPPTASLRRLRRVPPGPHGVAHPRHGRHALPHREGPADLRRGRGRQDGLEARVEGRVRTSRSTTSWRRWSRSARWAPSPSCSACCPAWAR
ncbi:Signal recognition particle 54 kDa protein [Streptomyces alboniger]